MATPLRVTRWGNSLAVRIPKSLAQGAGLREGSTLAASLEDDGSLRLRPGGQQVTLDGLLRALDPATLHREQDWGGPVGEEAW